MKHIKITSYYIVLLFITMTIVPLSSTEIKADSGPPTVKININPYSIIYEGDIIDCDMTGEPSVMYWQINGQSKHTTFYGNDPIIFDPELTPLDNDYVDLTVYVENEAGSDSDTARVMIKRLFFGDIHFHSTLSDGKYKIDRLYKNAIKDNYLDFVCLTYHAEIIDAVEKTAPNPILETIQFYLNKILGRSEWKMIKDKAIEYNIPGRFTTFIGFEWSASAEYPGGYPDSPYGHEDVSHVNFYYRDNYSDAPKYSAWDKHTYDDVFQAMADEWDKGHLNLGFPHHPLIFNGFETNTVNWSCLADKMVNTSARDKILRGAEMYSCWGTAIGKFSDIPIVWPYLDKNLHDQTDAWVENGLWKWSENSRRGGNFALMASSDTHFQSRPGSALVRNPFRPFSFHPDNPAGIIAVYAVHNTRGEIWDAIYDCDMYGAQLLKSRVNVRYDDQMATGRWINCSSPLKIQITAQATFPGEDCSGRNMKPHGYSNDGLDYPIQDIWLVKKDRERERPWCKVIGHATSGEDMVVVNFEDDDVQPNDFYYIAVRQKGQNIKKIGLRINPNAPGDEYMTFIGPVFIDNVN